MIAREYISDNVAVISLTGEVDVYTAVTARASFIDAFNSGHYSLVLDMRRTEMLDSTGLGVITGALKRCRAHDGSAVLVIAHLRILKIFQSTGLWRVFRIFNDVTEAIEAVSSGDYGPIYPAGPHECGQLTGSFDLAIYSADFDASLGLRTRLLAVLKEFAIEPVFLCPDDDGMTGRHAMLRSSGYASRDDQIEALCDAIERYVNAAPAPDGTDDRLMREFVTTLIAVRDATIRIGSALIACADSEIVTRIFDLEEFTIFRNDHQIRDSKGIVSALKSIDAS